MTAEEKLATPGSSNIASYASSPARSVLIVEFKDKAGNVTSTWEYVKVPPSIFEHAKKAESIGKFIRMRVIGYYEGHEVS
jgi:hypothetical protein